MKVGCTEGLLLAQLCFAKQPTAPKGREWDRNPASGRLDEPGPPGLGHPRVRFSPNSLS